MAFIMHLVGPAALTAVQEPGYDDGWLGARLQFGVDLTKPIKTIVFGGYCPDIAMTGRLVTLAVDDAKTRRVVRPGLFQLPLVLDRARSGRVTIEITASTGRAATDPRDLSVIAQWMQFLEP